MTDALEVLVREFVQKVRALTRQEMTAEMDGQLSAIQTEFAKAGTILAGLAGRHLGRQPRKNAGSKAIAAAAPKAGKRVRRSPKQLEDQAATILTAVKKKPGLRINALAELVGMTVADMQTPIAVLKNELKQVKTKGLKRTTTYWPK